MARDFLDDLSGDPDIVDIPNLKDIVDPGSTMQDPETDVTALTLSNALDKVSTEQQLIHSYHAVMEHITSQGKINQADVKLALSSIPDLLGSRLVLEQFTEQHSTVFYDDFMNCLKKRISQEEATVQLNIKAFFDEQLEDMEKFCHHFQKYYRPSIQNGFRTLIENNQKLLSQYKNSQDFTVPTEASFVNVLTEPLHQFKKIQLKLEKGAAFAYDGQMSADGIFDLINEYRVLLLINGVTGNYDITDYTNRLLSMDVGLSAEVVSYNYFLDMLTSPTILSVFDEIEIMLNNVIANMKQLQTELNQSETGFSDFDKFMMNAHDQLKVSLLQFEFAQIVSRRLMAIQPLLNKGMQFLSSLV